MAVIINGVSYEGNNIVVNNGRVFVDGANVAVDVLQSVSKVVNLNISGNVGTVEVTNGSVTCNNISSTVQVTNGNIQCNRINGNVNLTNGKITYAIGE